MGSIDFCVFNETSTTLNYTYVHPLSLRDALPICPQGGMNTDETPLEAMFRELREETGLLPEHVEVLGATPGWLRYRLPQRAIRRNDRLVCIGQRSEEHTSELQ